MTKSKENRELMPVWYWGPNAMFEEMERFMNDRGRDRLWFPAMMRPSHRVPAVDVREEEDQYVVSAELPGMAKEDVSIEVGDGVLEITAKKEQDREEKGEGYLRRERGAMCFQRRLTLPEDVDPQAIEAKLAEGVLEVRLPKVEKGSDRKKVEVQ